MTNEFWQWFSEINIQAVKRPLNACYIPTIVIFERVAHYFIVDDDADFRWDKSVFNMCTWWKDVILICSSLKVFCLVWNAVKRSTRPICNGKVCLDDQFRENCQLTFLSNIYSCDFIILFVVWHNGNSINDMAFQYWIVKLS